MHKSARERWYGRLRGILILVTASVWVSRADAGGTPGRTSWVSFAATVFTPTGDFKPFDEGHGGGLAVQYSIMDERYPVGLRFELGSGFGSSATLRDSAALAVYAEGHPGTAVSMQASNNVFWFTAGLQTGPRENASGLYAFATGGIVNVDSSILLEFEEGGLTQSEDKVPAPGLSFGASGGAGGRWIFGKKKKNGISAEWEYLWGAETEYLASPEAAADYANTHLLTARGNVTGWTVQLAYMHRFGRGAEAPKSAR